MRVRLHRGFAVPAALALAFVTGLPAAPPPGDWPVLQSPLDLVVPRELWHLTDTWDSGEALLRVDAEGRVVDWVPLRLPDHRLVPALERALETARFDPAYENGEPVTTDVPIKIPLYEIGPYIVVTEDLGEHIESREATADPKRNELLLSRASELDQPLQLISRGEPVAYAGPSGEPLAGTVMVEFFIGTDGHTHLTKTPGEPDPLLAEAARQTAAQLRFSPPTRGLKPTVVKARVPIVLAAPN